MLDKCANPACNTRFKYLRGGRLFLLHGEEEQGPDGLSTSPRPEHFWLCCRCSASRTLLLEAQDRVTCVPLSGAWGPGGPGPGVTGTSARLVSTSAWRSLPLRNDALGGWCCDE